MISKIINKSIPLSNFEYPGKTLKA